jgi:hypothetical protein
VVSPPGIGSGLINLKVESELKKEAPPAVGLSKRVASVGRIKRDPVVNYTARLRAGSEWSG